MILDEIVAYKRGELARRRRAVPLAALQAMAVDRPAPLDFTAALARDGVRLIAEVKRASPSKGLLCADLDPTGLAMSYAQQGAAAVSVLTDAHFFQGAVADLARIAFALRAAYFAVPVLRKDFIFDPYQVHEAYAYGADALLLIAAILSDAQLAELLALTHALDMTALVEVHDGEEADRVARLHAARGLPTVVGVNNRDLRDFSVDLGTFGRLRPRLPQGIVAVAESGVHAAADVRRLRAMGADAVLVGEALVTAEDPSGAVRALARAGEGAPCPA